MGCRIVYLFVHLPSFNKDMCQVQTRVLLRGAARLLLELFGSFRYHLPDPHVGHHVQNPIRNFFPITFMHLGFSFENGARQN